MLLKFSILLCVHDSLTIITTQETILYDFSEILLRGFQNFYIIVKECSPGSICILSSYLADSNFKIHCYPYRKLLKKQIDYYNLLEILLSQVMS